MRVIQAQGNYRLVEHEDIDFRMSVLKGDMYKPDCAPHLSLAELKKEERDFEQLVEEGGVFGYVLEKWNPAVGVGWEHEDSCWGFIGAYDKSNGAYNHDFVVEALARMETIV